MAKLKKVKKVEYRLTFSKEEAEQLVAVVNHVSGDVLNGVFNALDEEVDYARWDVSFMDSGLISVVRA